MADRNDEHLVINMKTLLLVTFLDENKIKNDRQILSRF